MDWTEQAKALQEGNSRRVNCPFCGTPSKNTAKLQHKDTGVSIFCFSCKESRFKGHGARSISALKLRFAFNVANAWHQEPVIKLPLDFTLDIPEQHALWLYKSSVFSTTAKDYGIGWSDSMQRVVIPVYNDSALVYTQARAVHPGMKPKYLNKKNASKSSVYFESKESTFKVVPEDTCCLVEAALSVIRCGWYCKTFSALGSDLTDSLAYKLSKYKQVLVWYDPDKAGAEGTAKAVRKLSMLGCSAIKIATNKKPKEYTNSEIQEIITKAYARRH